MALKLRSSNTAILRAMLIFLSLFLPHQYRLALTTQIFKPTYMITARDTHDTRAHFFAAAKPDSSDDT